MSLLQNKARLVIEHEAMKVKYPAATLHQDPDGTLCWRFVVRVLNRAFPVRIVYPANYPSSAPHVFSDMPLPICPHRLGDRELCWTDRYHDHGHWQPAVHTAVVALTEAHRWFANMLVWKTTGNWPRRSEH